MVTEFASRLETWPHLQEKRERKVVERSLVHCRDEMLRIGLGTVRVADLVWLLRFREVWLVAGVSWEAVGIKTSEM